MAAWRQNRVDSGPRFCASRVPAGARGRRLWAGPSGSTEVVIRAGWIAWQALMLRASRAETTVSLEGAKPRSSDE